MVQQRFGKPFGARRVDRFVFASLSAADIHRFQEEQFDIRKLGGK
jgi:hypothetical protein